MFWPRMNSSEGVLSEHLEEIDLSNAFKEESWIRLKLQLNADHKQKPSAACLAKAVPNRV